MAVCIYVVECKIQWENFHRVTFACYWKDPVRKAIEVKQQQKQHKKKRIRSVENEIQSSKAKRAQSTKREKKRNLSHKNPYNETKFIEQLIEMLYLLEQLSRTLFNFSTFVLYFIFCIVDFVFHHT